MKLYGLYEHQNLDELHYNHQKFCEYNNISYNKFYIRGYHDKYHLIYHLLGKNPGETILFVDSNSYFKHLKYEFEFTEDIAIQKSGESVFTNFIVVRSTAESISIFKALLLEASRSVVVERSMDFSPKIPEKYILGELFQQNGAYLNVDICQHANFNSANIMVCYVKPDNWGCFSYANAICNYKPSIYKTSDKNYEVINPGMKNALVSLYTPEIKDIGVISETSISDYCLKNDITFYIHRELHSDFGQMTGNWAKSKLLLQYIKQHEYLGWIDSDIIISKDYEMLFEDEVHVYNDPCAWEFNSGFMVFKNTQKNEVLLRAVTDRTANLNCKDSVYVNGGDQAHFIHEIKSHYPSLLAGSNMLTNSHIDFQLIDTNKKMIHFMGLPIHIRRIMMDVYWQKFQNN
jgi:hypothetical protein